MNKKLYIILILALALIPIAAASVSEGVENTLSMIFDATEDLIYIKAGLWIVLFFLIFKSTERLFPTSRGMAMVISAVVAMLGARFLPEDYLDFLSSYYSIILGILFLLSPFFVGNFIGSLARFQKRGKAFLIIIFYAVLAFSLTKWQGYSLDVGRGTGVKREALNAFDIALTNIGEYKILVWVAIGIFCAYIIWSSGRGIRMPRQPGPGFRYGLGKGMGQALGIGKRRAMGLWDRLRRRRAMQQLTKQLALKKKLIR